MKQGSCSCWDPCPSEGLETPCRSVETASEGGVWVATAETPFFPGGGGQPRDRGRIDGMPLLDLRRRDGLWWHRVARKPDADRVRLRRDEAYRRELASQHSGQHLLSALAWTRWGGQTLGFHLGEMESTVDLDVDPIEESEIDLLEGAVTEWIRQGLPFVTDLLDPARAELPAMLRKAPPSEGLGETLRIVHIGDRDAVPCCGTHVKNTSELAPFRILACSSMRGRARIHFQCGERARQGMRLERGQLLGAARSLDVKPAELEMRCRSLLHERMGLRREKGALQEELWWHRFLAESLDGSLAGGGGPCRIWESTGLPPKGLGRLAASLAERAETSVLLVQPGEGRCDLALARPSSQQHHCGQILGTALKGAGGRGGGNAAQAQGAIAREAWPALLHALTEGPGTGEAESS